MNYLYKTPTLAQVFTEPADSGLVTFLFKLKINFVEWDSNTNSVEASLSDEFGLPIEILKTIWQKGLLLLAKKN